VDKGKVVGKFVSLAARHNWARKPPTKLSEDELRTLKDVLTAAGFGNVSLVLGSTVQLTTTCPYKVVNEQGNDQLAATGWLDIVLHHACTGLVEFKPRGMIINEVWEDIEQAAAHQPVHLDACA